MQIESNQGLKLTGFYRGKVIKHCPILSSDSESGFGKCKVYIPGVYPEEYDNIDMADFLPDAEQISPLFGGSYDGNGIYSYPNLGSIVICGFWNGDQNYPFFWGATLGGNGSKAAYKHVNAMQGDKECRKTGKDAILHKIRCKNTTIDICENGYIDIDVLGANGGFCKVNINGDGNVSINTSTQLDIHAPTIAITGGQKISMVASDIAIKADNTIDIRSDNAMVLHADVGMKQTANSITIAADYDVKLGKKKTTPFR